MNLREIQVRPIAVSRWPMAVDSLSECHKIGRTAIGFRPSAIGRADNAGGLQ